MKCIPDDFSTHCPVCQASATDNLGPLARIKGLFDVDDPGNLYHCPACNLFFRRPYMLPETLLRHYRELSIDSWSGARNDCPDYHLAKRAIQKYKSSGNVLDIGCARGDFLSLLGSRYRKFGIEPADSLAESARSKGICIAASSIDNYTQGKSEFDVISLIDVVEHLPHPYEILLKATSLLSPGGILVILTGNTNAWLWKLMRFDYWYYCTEHCSFFSPQWIDWFVRSRKLRLRLLQPYSHYSSTNFKKLRQVLDCFVYITLKNSKRYSLLSGILSRIYPFNRALLWPSIPSAHFLRDHMLVVLQKDFLP
jgi:SAM-dependent methyltransferase